MRGVAMRQNVGDAWKIDTDRGAPDTGGWPDRVEMSTSAGLRAGLKNLAPVACAVGGNPVGASGVTVNDV